jgi:hypothetical protein
MLQEFQKLFTLYLIFFMEEDTLLQETSPPVEDINFPQKQQIAKIIAPFQFDSRISSDQIVYHINQIDQQIETLQVLNKIIVS